MIAAGSKLGAYEVVAQIGAGGMGEVYRARDTRLNRDVAIKVLPEAFAHDPHRLARFQREAKTLAALNHPNIATIHGLEEANGTHYLVMELVPGETLADRIERESAVPVEEALTIAKQIAEALEAAHEKGIVHRDLKPANVKVTPEGKVKVLDFGLAKAFAGDGASEDIGNSPTLSMAATQQGIILGTAAYMSPEQAKGKQVTKATDIFAFGAVLYELLTGRQAFQGEDVGDILAAVVKTDPDWSRLPEATPAAICTLLCRCLRKDRHQRLADAGAVRIEIEDVLSGAVPAEPTLTEVVPRLPLWRRAMPAFIALCLGAVLAGGGVWLLTRPAPARVVRTEITTSTGAALVIQGTTRDVAISPDGSHIVYRGDGQLLVRALDQIAPTPLTGIGAAPSGVFFSPNGEWVGFYDRTTLMKVAVTGGPPVTICSLAGLSRGATWGPNGTIVFATNNSSTGLLRVSEGGGEPAVLTKPNHEVGETNHLWPEFLPGGQAVLFTITTSGGTDNSQVAVLDLRTGVQKIVLRGGSDAHYVESGHLVYAAAGTLRAVRFDLKSMETAGMPVPVVPQAMITGAGAADFDVARNGTLVYVPGGPEATPRSLVWVDRKGVEQPLRAPPHTYRYPRLSPDGQHMAVTIEEGGSNNWNYDLRRDTLTRLTFEGTPNLMGAWTPDGKRIAFGSSKEGTYNLYWQLADGSGGLERLRKSEHAENPNSWSPDGQALAFIQVTPATGYDIWVLRMSDHKAQPFVQTPSTEGGPSFSPDGHWLAYVSDESGRFEIYVQPYPGPGGKYQISTDGGTESVWNPKGEELFYRQGDKMMAVDVTAQPKFSASKPRMLFEGQYVPTPATFPDYDVSADGQRFLMVKAAGQAQASAQINVVLNWTEELKRLVAAGTK